MLCDNKICSCKVNKMRNMFWGNFINLFISKEEFPGPLIISRKYVHLIFVAVVNMTFSNSWDFEMQICCYTF